ncbi:hypothetical protein GCM10009555_090240 [Acrocarpospora macrocephala]|uniref:Uncharacterized protein n=1 Tax=Acrocarpospora macrocephala TaxID=150177 RepID=A0A5M3WKN5_9ACTN|nr:hypothetical protein Amac_025960 [Acrocarpospora macrocephala]
MIGPVAGGASPTQALFALVTYVAPLLRFWLWALGVPGLGREMLADEPESAETAEGQGLPLLRPAADRRATE